MVVLREGALLIYFSVVHCVFWAFQHIQVENLCIQYT